MIDPIKKEMHPYTWRLRYSENIDDHDDDDDYHYCDYDIDDTMMMMITIIMMILMMIDPIKKQMHWGG